jgi:hypothetical protein
MSAWVVLFSLILAFEFTFPFFVWYWLERNKDKLSDEEFQTKYASMYLNLRTNNNAVRRYYSIYSFKRIAFVTNLMFFANKTHILTFNFLVIQSAYLVYLCRTMPHEDRWHSKQEIFNEFMIMLVGYTMMFHIKDQPMYNSLATSNQQYVSGYFTLGLILSCFFLSMVVLLYENYRNVRKCLIRRRNRKEHTKRMKNRNKVHPSECFNSVTSEEPNGLEPDTKRTGTTRNLMGQQL